MDYFVNIKTLEELKATYRKFAMINHPDVGGDTATMQAINNEYDIVFEIVKSFHVNKDGETYTKATNETPEQFRETINALLRLRMPDVTIEIIGCFLWVSGATKPFKDDIKALGFRWATNKSSWYIAPENYRKHNGKQYTMSDIRGMFGSSDIANEYEAQRALA